MVVSSISFNHQYGLVLNLCNIAFISTTGCVGKKASVALHMGNTSNLWVNIISLPFLPFVLPGAFSCRQNLSAIVVAVA